MDKKMKSNKNPLVRFRGWIQAAATLKDKLCEKGAQYLGCDVDDVDFDGQCVVNIKTGTSISRAEIGNRVMCNNEEALYASEAYSSPISPLPFMVGMAEVEIDKETGELELIDYAHQTTPILYP